MNADTRTPRPEGQSEAARRYGERAKAFAQWHRSGRGATATRGAVGLPADKAGFGKATPAPRRPQA
ncbi:MAG: hypothetical protein U1F18_06930 [Steroidobacteraceae bacterium]